MDFLKRWFFNRQRFVFSYWNGHRTVKADPMVIWRLLQQCDDFREEDFKLLSIEATRNDTVAKIAGVVRSVFSIPSLEDGGLTELECLGVMNSFIAYSGFQKKSGGQMQTSLSPTDMALFDDSLDETPQNESLVST